MSDPITTTRPGSRSRSLLLKAAVVVPNLIIASLLWLMIIALLPPAIGFMVAVLGITVAALVAAGVGEDAVVRVLYRARRAASNEAPRLTVAWRIATHHSDTPVVRLRIVTHGPPVATAGRRHLLVRRDIVDAYVANDVNAHHVAAFIAEGVGRLRHGHTRFDLLWTVWTIPWGVLRGLAHAIARRLAGLPLVRFAWQVRFVVGSIAIGLEAQAGRWPSSVIVGAFLAMTYLMPLAARRWERHQAGEAQAHVGDRGGRVTAALASGRAQPCLSRRC